MPSYPNSSRLINEKKVMGLMIHSKSIQKQITFMYRKANFCKRLTITRNIYTHTYRFFFFWFKHHIPKTMKSMRINLIWLSTPIPKMQHGWIEMQRIVEWSKPKSLVKNFLFKDWVSRLYVDKAGSRWIWSVLWITLLMHIMIWQNLKQHYALSI